ncbi:MAG TPA: archaemetzincin [Thermoanaerobaculia bacterium]|nr:archaemetzincin [Thermoanaerobaculia bacterium]
MNGKPARVVSLAVLLVVLLLATVHCDRPRREPPGKPIQGPTVQRLRTVMQAVDPLFIRKGKPAPERWMATYNEPGQTFDQYLASRPRHATATRNKLYIQPIGPFSAEQSRIVELTADYMGRFFGLPVEVQPALPITDLPARAHRVHPMMGPQLRTGYLMGKFLLEGLPDNAAARVGFVTSDLFPDESMNFVFGQASLRDRVGVWSLHHLGEPEKGDRDFQLALLRTIKIAAHETGHMFSLKHCRKYECVMNGAISLEELDMTSIEACPECMAKLCWATDADPRARYKKLAAFWRGQGLVPIAEFFEKAAEAVDARGI